MEKLTIFCTIACIVLLMVHWCIPTPPYRIDMNFFDKPVDDYHTEDNLYVGTEFVGCHKQECEWCDKVRNYQRDFNK